jgi:hypothetical protein
MLICKIVTVDALMAGNPLLLQIRSLAWLGSTMSTSLDLKLIGGSKLVHKFTRKQILMLVVLQKLLPLNNNDLSPCLQVHCRREKESRETKSIEVDILIPKTLEFFFKK